MSNEKIENKPLEVDIAADERSTSIDIGGEEYKLILTTKATKEIAVRPDRVLF